MLKQFVSDTSPTSKHADNKLKREVITAPLAVKETNKAGRRYTDRLNQINPSSLNRCLTGNCIRKVKVTAERSVLQLESSWAYRKFRYDATVQPNSQRLTLPAGHWRNEMSKSKAKMDVKNDAEV